MAMHRAMPNRLISALLNDLCASRLMACSCAFQAVWASFCVLLFCLSIFLQISIFFTFMMLLFLSSASSILNDFCISQQLSALPEPPSVSTSTCRKKIRRAVDPHEHLYVKPQRIGRRYPKTAINSGTDLLKHRRDHEFKKTKFSPRLPPHQIQDKNSEAQTRLQEFKVTPRWATQGPRRSFSILGESEFFVRHSWLAWKQCDLFDLEKY
jgi:hypothetical protein